MSTAYHPETDGQTEVYNRVLEQYLRSFVHHQPSQWSKFLSLAEWAYNTSVHSSTGFSPFQITYGREPPSIPHYIMGTSKVEAVDSMLSQRQTLILKLRQTILKSQTRMKHFADQKRREVTFFPGQFVYIRLRPYRQQSVSTKPYNKLSKRFYGPFEILERIGPVAYRLQLPPHSKIHPVFHCSLLKLHHGPIIAPGSLPPQSTNSQPIITPLAILDQKEDTTTDPPSKMVLVQWEGLPTEDTSWENWDSLKLDYHLEDKVILPDPGDVSKDTHIHDPSTSRPTRLIKRPSHLEGYV
jgi:hypothetical protein